MNNDTLTADLTEATIDAEQAAEARLAEISALMAAKQAETEQAEDTPKAKLAPFTCPMDPAERAACDSCQ